MMLLDGAIYTSATDIMRAGTCEYALLCAMDRLLGRREPGEAADDPLLAEVGRLGTEHERAILDEMRRRGTVHEIVLDGPPRSVADLRGAVSKTVQAASARPDVIFQAPIGYDGFLGYADFLEATEGGWRVCDAKLARSPRPATLLQLAAYAHGLAEMGLPVAPDAALLLGTGERVSYPLARLFPVLHELRRRMSALIGKHRDADGPADWDADGISLCGSCDDCAATAAKRDDVLLVAGLRMDQRKALRAAGIGTVAELANASGREAPAGMTSSLYERLCSQARLQVQQLRSGTVSFELTAEAARVLALLPAPSDGDLFFDFEGDALYQDDDARQSGLEYLWGYTDAAERYTPLWAHDRRQERAAFIEFIDMVTARREQHPDMHVYHYAPYETSALKRLAARYQVRQEALDRLLRCEVFIDLYATVRGAIRISQPSYSIKKLEPLYMGAQLREGDVTDGAGSIVAYEDYRRLAEDDPEAARRHLADLADYNEYDCLSTLRLRDWLLDRARDAGVRELIAPRTISYEPVDDGPAQDEDPLFVELMELAGEAAPAARNSTEQLCAMMASALGYHRREQKQFWWEHFERLGSPVQDWADTRDVFAVESSTVLSQWSKPESARARNLRRRVRLRGQWAPGSRPRSGCFAVFRAPGPDRAGGPDSALYRTLNLYEVYPSESDPGLVDVVFTAPEDALFSEIPVALAPGSPPDTQRIAEAIREIATEVRSNPTLNGAAADVLRRTPPRLRGGGALPPAGPDMADAVCAALDAMDDSYVAVQGPPGAGKTYVGSRVIKWLVEERRWRIGVVAQSHAVVENLLDAVVKAGLDPALVGKKPRDASLSSEPATETAPSWTRLAAKGTASETAFQQQHADSGFVIGGTQWLFTNADKVGRGELDLLVIDEAGQFALAPTIAASIAARRLLLLGDPQQLPQVTQGTHAEPVDESALGWLMGAGTMQGVQDTLDPRLGYFLPQTYRMHPALCARVSRLSYGGQLTAAAPPAQRELAGTAPGLRIVRIDHRGCRTESPEEAAEVVRQVRSLIGTQWTDPDDAASPRELTEPDFLVVAPYNAQVALIRRRLVAAGLSDVRVGTVDLFQGQEAPVAIASMTASAAAEVPRGMDFLLNRNRINVAISRAQWLAILIRSESLTHYLPGSVHGLLELGAFVGLGEE